jgi:hypothetical protein
MNRFEKGSATQVMLLQKLPIQTAFVVNALQKQRLPSSITCVALPKLKVLIVLKLLITTETI